MCQQSVVYELGTRAEVRRDVCVCEIVHLDAHVGDVHALVKHLAGVDAGAVSGVHHVSDAEAFETGFIHRHRPAAQNSGSLTINNTIYNKYNNTHSS